MFPKELLMGHEICKFKTGLKKFSRQTVHGQTALLSTKTPSGRSRPINNMRERSDHWAASAASQAGGGPKAPRGGIIRVRSPLIKLENARSAAKRASSACSTYREQRH